MTVRVTLGAGVARLLEQGVLGDAGSRAISAVWACLARASRPVEIPPRARVIGVGGATLGGSYKTPLVLALARTLAERGACVSVVGHGYRSASSPLNSTRRVVESSAARTAGDDAAWLARALAPVDVPVVVGRDRARAIRAAASLAPLVLVDGLLQTSERRLALSILALDGASPWGAGACPPAGDLRAPRPSLLAAADVVVRILSDAGRDADRAPAPSLEVGARPLFDVRAILTGATPLGGVAEPTAPRTSLATLRGLRVGVVLAIARPDRVLASLAAHGVTPVEVRLFRDHGRPRARPFGLGRARIDAWLTTPKCATKMTTERTYEGRRVLVLEQRLSIPLDLVEMVEGAARPAAPATARSEQPRPGGVLPALGELEF